MVTLTLQWFDLLAEQREGLGMDLQNNLLSPDGVSC